MCVVQRTLARGNVRFTRSHPTRHSSKPRRLSRTPSTYWQFHIDRTMGFEHSWRRPERNWLGDLGNVWMPSSPGEDPAYRRVNGTASSRRLGKTWPHTAWVSQEWRINHRRSASINRAVKLYEPPKASVWPRRVRDRRHINRSGDGVLINGLVEIHEFGVLSGTYCRWVSIQSLIVNHQGSHQSRVNVLFYLIKSCVVLQSFDLLTPPSLKAIYTEYLKYHMWDLD